MTVIVEWAAARARMVLIVVMLSLGAGAMAYISLPKEGEPDIAIPILFISVPFQGISAEDSESLLVKPLESELAGLDGLKSMTSTAAEGYAGVLLEFDFGWDKTRVMAEVRDSLNAAESQFPDGADKSTISEFNFSEFPIVVVSLSGAVPERTINRVARDLQDQIESIDAVLEAALAGDRQEMLEVVIDPLRLESYNVTAGELINVVRNNNQLIAAGEVETDQGAFAVKIPSSFNDAGDARDLPIKVNGDRVITLGDLADIHLTFEDRRGTARFNGQTTVALQVVKRKGFNIIDTVGEIRTLLAKERAAWPAELRAAVSLAASNDQSRQVRSMVSQLEGAVLTAILLVMLVMLVTLGMRPALLVGFAIPTSFLTCFVLLSIMGVAVSNIVMFGLILAVGMLVDSAIVVVEYGDRRIAEGVDPMRAYVAAAKRMFWPIVSSTATTLCAFLPMLFWPGVPGEFMGMLPVTLIFVLSASLIVALIYLPVMGGMMGGISRIFANVSARLRARVPYLLRLPMVFGAAAITLIFVRGVFSPEAVFGPGGATMMPVAAIGVAVGFILLAITIGSVRIHLQPDRVTPPQGSKSPIGPLIRLIVGNPVMPIITIAGVAGCVVAVFAYFANNNHGVEFFVESETEQAIVYVKARGNMSLVEKDELLRLAEQIVLGHPGVHSAFAFAGEGGVNSNTGGAQAPKDTIGRIQFETIPWEERMDRPDLDGDLVVAEIDAALARLPGIETEILSLARGPASQKPVHLRLSGNNHEVLLATTQAVRAQFNATPGLTLIEDTMPLPGIDWQINVDVAKAGRFGADVATVGAMVQLITRGLLLDTMRTDSSDEEIDIRVRLPRDDRVLSTLDTLKVRTRDGLVPLANFVTRKPVAKLAEINRDSQKRYFDVRADTASGMFKLVSSNLNGGETNLGTLRIPTGIAPATPAQFSLDGSAYEIVTLDPAAHSVPESRLRLVPLNANERIAHLTEWLADNPLPAGIDWAWTGDQEDQAESQAFLQTAFTGALGLMFIILLAQFNSLFNALLVLMAVILSTTGVLIGMLVMEQSFSVIMTGTGIVALAGIVVNNNIVLVDTYQEYAAHMSRIQAIVRTVEVRMRPVLLTTITTMAGLAPMMFGLSVNLAQGSYSIDAPAALWWKQLATAVVFGLGTATILTLLFTPSMLALRVWLGTGAYFSLRRFIAIALGANSDSRRDMALARAARRIESPEVIWDEAGVPFNSLHREEGTPSAHPG